MRLSPDIIRKQLFNKKMRGYDADEVDTFVEQVASEIEMLRKEKDEIQNQLDAAVEKIRQYKKIEKTLQATLISTQESSSKSMDSVKKHAALIVKEAELKAAQIVEKAKETANELRDTIIKLRDEKRLLIAKIKAVIDTQTEIINFNKETVTTAEPVAEHKPSKASGDINVDEIVESIL